MTKELSSAVRGLYEVVQRQETDMNAEGILLRHKKTGARVALMPCEDSNKVFYIGFRTPPTDSTGVAHIIEHTVLCGSRQFPVKDPFVELIKGSLNTFLNAMTYPDKTVYPVASTNDQDFRNLMHVYLDAVFHPNIYATRHIFEQEGWHYEVDEDGKLKVNGVVYNEMRGALSSPDDVLARGLYSALYPHTPYANESGGDPQVIPELTYEDYLDFHRRYYHPSNSYIWLYGDCDMNERLLWIDAHYLSQYDHLDIDSTIPTEPAFAAPVEAKEKYSILAGEPTKNRSYLSWNVCLSEDLLQGKTELAMRILDYALCDAEGAPLRRALRKRGIGQEVYSMLELGLRQPSWTIVAKDTEMDRKQEFVDTIRGTLQGIVRDGFDAKSLEAAISYYEFRYRETDASSTPKGLIFGLNALDTWLYEEDAVFGRLQLGSLFDELRADAGKGYFEKLIETYLLDNPHEVIYCLEPEQGLAARKDEALEKKLADYAASLSEEDLSAIREEEAALRQWQETPDAAEDLLKIPMLKREDMKRQARRQVNQVVKAGDVTIVEHPLPTTGIEYVNLIFNLDDLPNDYLPYLGIFKTLFAVMDTEHYSYTELNNEINIRTGGVSGSFSAYTQARDLTAYTFTFEVSTKVLRGHLPEALDLLTEILTRTDYGSRERLCEVLEEERSAMRAGLTQSGHTTAAMRALSYLGETAALMEKISGVEAYETLCGVCERLLSEDEAIAEAEGRRLAQVMTSLARIIFRREALIVSVTAPEEDLADLPQLVDSFADTLFEESFTGMPFYVMPEKKNEGFGTSGQGQYVCRAGNFRKRGLRYTGALRVLKVILGFDYLWQRIRVKGGAYGCMSAFSRDGSAYLVSYRDPHLRETMETFEGAADYIRHFEADERTMTKYIIGAVSAMDRPLSAAALGTLSMNAYLTGSTDEGVQRERDQVLDAEPSDIRALGDYLDAVMEDQCLCVVGAEDVIEKNQELFGSTRTIG